MGLLRIAEWIFFIYFFTHIPVTILLDSQALAPREWYPEQVLELTEWYVTELKDTYFANPPWWYKSFVLCEQFIQMPFFFVASYAFLKGSCSWIRIPIIVYGSHVATTVFPMLLSFAFEDFSKYEPVGPETPQERLILMGIYAPYLFIPLLMLGTMLFSKTYSGQKQPKPQSKQKAKKPKAY